MNFRDRTAKFWLRFEKQEGQLRNLIDENLQQATELFSSLIKTAFKDISFELGKNEEGKYEVVLSPEGNRAKAFITYYWKDQAPEKLREKWNFYATKPAKKLASYKIDDKEISAKEIFLDYKINKARGLLDITLYADKWEFWDPSLKMRMLFLLLDGTLGEEDVEKYIGNIEFGRGPAPQDAVRLDNLPERIKELSKKYEWEKQGKIIRLLTTYEREPQEKNKALRADIFFGLTSLFNIITNAERDTKPFEELEEDGVESGYLVLENKFDNLEQMPGIKDDIEKKIMAIHNLHLFADVTGNASGTMRAYLDFIIYDYNNFIKSLRTAFEDYKGIDINYYKFTAPSKKISITKPESLFKKLFG